MPPPESPPVPSKFMKDKHPIDPDLIISVESRKGGVGKTTAAMCLARLLRKRGYAVLLLDLDVTGTNAADIAGSPFWRDDLHIIRDEAQGNPNSGSLPPAVNLLTLFDDFFMVGNPVPTFSTQSSANHMRVDLEKVNVLGSQIYKTEHHKDEQKAKNDAHRESGTTIITRPGILFDDLHTLWLLDFVKQITNGFSCVAGGTAGKIAVILDNSPGYVGIAPAIHDWLTDYGPQCGKFLTVTSLDFQDLLACERAIASLHDLYTGKWKTSRLFIEASGQGAEITVSKAQENFFMRLAAAPPKDAPDGMDSLAFYKAGSPTRRGIKNPERLSQQSSFESDTTGQKFCGDPATYIGAVINRVPRAVKTGWLSVPNSVGFRPR